jgi:hypothetical protein
LVNAPSRHHFKSETCSGRIFKISGLLKSPQAGTGETMSDQAIRNARYPICRRTQGIQDFLLVSSFGVWAALLGLSPLLAFHLLMRS